MDEYGHDPTSASVASARYASPKAGGYSESYYESPSSSWYSGANTGVASYAPHSTTYHNAAHSALLGTHGHEQHYAMPNIGHNESSLSQQVKHYCGWFELFLNQLIFVFRISTKHFHPWVHSEEMQIHQVRVYQIKILQQFSMLPWRLIPTFLKASTVRLCKTINMLLERACSLYVFVCSYTYWANQLRENFLFLGLPNWSKY